MLAILLLISDICAAALYKRGGGGAGGQGGTFLGQGRHDLLHHFVRYCIFSLLSKLSSDLFIHIIIEYL